MFQQYMRWVVGGLLVGLVALVGLISTGFLSDLNAQTLERSSAVRLQLHDDQYGWRSSALIALTTQQAPEIAVNWTPPDSRQRAHLIGSVTVDVYEILPEELIDSLVYESYEEDGRTQYQNINHQPSDEQLIASINYTNYSNQDPILLPVEGVGAWLVRVSVNDTYYNDVVVHRSGIASVVKNSDSSLLFWTQDINSGKRVSGGFVEMYNLDTNAVSLNTATIDADGIASVPVDDRADVAVVRTISGEYGIIPLNIPETEYYRNEQFRPLESNTKFYLFTDRPVYQPGDTVYYKAIIREDNDAVYTVPDGTAQVKIYRNWNDSESPLYSELHFLSETGSIDGSFTLPSDSETGYFQIEVSDPTSDRERWLRTVESFQVETYRKPEYFLDSAVLDSEVVRGEDIVFNVTGEYFFGQPLAYEDVQVGVSQRDFYYSYWMDEAALERRIQYGNYWRSANFDETHALNGAGIAQITIPTDDSSRFSVDSTSDTKPVLVTLDAQYNDESGNNTQTSANVLVWPAEFSILRDGSWRSAVVDKPHEVTFVVRSHVAGPVADVALAIGQELKWWERTERSGWTSKSKQSQYTYNEQSENLADAEITTDSSGRATFSFTPTRSGSHRFTVTATDTEGRDVQTSFSVWVRDPSRYTYWGSGNEQYKAGISIVADRDDSRYEDGESAQLTIANELSGRDVWLTTERRSVIRHEVVSVPEFVTTIPYNFEANDLPNVYVSVSSFGLDGFGSDTTELKLDTSRQETNVALSFDQTSYAPGETVTATIKTTSELTNAPVATEVTLWSVDKALYEVAADRRDNITDFFWRDRYNSTTRAHSLQGINSTGGAEKGCFAPGTMVQVPGGHVAIEDIEIGDLVVTRTDAGELVEAAVTDAFTHEVDGYLIINGKLKVTPEHILWVNDTWTMAGEVQVGDRLLSSAGTVVPVDSLEWQRGEFTVHNITVADEHTYIAEDVWVHNEKGGGGARTEFTDVAYWNPQIRTDSNGEAVVRFTLPDNLTIWVMNAVAANQATEVGEALEEFVVTKPVIVRPILPNYVRVGDALTIANLIYNYTGESQDFSLACGLEDQSTIGTEAIATGDFATFLNAQLAFRKPGEGAYNCEATATQSGESDRIEVPFSIRAYGFMESESFVAVGDTTQELRAYPDVDRARSTVAVVVTPSVFGTLPEAMNYLVQYPYGCVEQTTSRFVPAVIASENQVLFADYLGTKEVDEMVAAGVKRLHALKGSKHGWSWWNDDEINPLLTAYVSEYLLRAEAQGHELPYDVKRSIQFFANNVISRTENGTAVSVTEEVAASYVQILLDEKKPSQLLLREDLTSDTLALGIIANAAHGYSVETEIEWLLAQAESFGDGLIWPAGDSRLFGSADASTALALKALVAADRSIEAAQAVLTLSRNRNQSYWSNTFATAQAMDALVSYADYANERTGGVTNYQVLADGEVVQTGQLLSLYDRERIELLVPEESTTVEVKALNGAPLFSTITWDQFRTSRDLPASNEGLLVHRAYQGDFVPGETIDVILTVQGENIDRQPLVIEDFLPAGLVPVNTNLENEQTNREYNRYSTNREFKDDGVVVAYRWWDGDAVRHIYKARVVSRGTFTAPPPVASLMYLPEIAGRGQTHTVRIADADSDNGVIYNSDPELEAPIALPNYRGTYWSDGSASEKAEALIDGIVSDFRWSYVAGAVGAILLLVVGVLYYRFYRALSIETETDHEPTNETE